jgi:hypothetical protein
MKEPSMLRVLVMSRVLVAAWLIVISPIGQAAPDDPVLSDSGLSTGRSTGIFFFVEAINGQALANNVFVASRRASNGLGADLRIGYVERTVVAGKNTLKLRLRGMNAAPIMSLFSKDAADLAGTLQVELKPGERYRVSGIYDNFRREMWVEEASGEKIVSEKLVFKFEGEDDPKLMEGAQFTCCNLHYDGDWIGDANFATAPMVPAGTRLKVVEMKSKHANVLLEGRKFRLGQEYGSKVEKLSDMLGKLLVNDDPKPSLQGLPEPIRAAVLSGKLRLGMNKAQVLVSMGPPRVDTTRDMALPNWIYYTFRLEPLKVNFDSNGLVVGFEGADEVKAALVLTD